MANWNNTKLTCSDLQRFTEIMKSNPFSGPHTAEAYEDKAVELNKDGAVFMQSRNTIPDQEITQLSKANPDLIFTAEYSFESDWESVITTIEYRGGEGKQLGERPNYMRVSTGSDAHKYIEDHIPEDYNKLIQRAEEIFARMDTVVMAGIPQVDFITEEVIIKLNTESYQMRVRKTVSEVEIIDLMRKQEVITKSTKLVPFPEGEGEGLPLPSDTF